MRKALSTFVLLGLALVLPSRAAAWHRDGHMAIARIAWKQLDDKERVQVSNILKSHPHYEVYLAQDRPKNLPELSEVEWVFMRAAVWSDWVRSPSGPGLDSEAAAQIRKDFHKGPWHYINLPYVHPEETDKFDAAAIREAILTPELDKLGEPRHVLAALKQSVKLLQAADTSDKDKAVHLSWLLHLAGDLHQPLHATGLLATEAKVGPERFDPPAGDEGGNRLAVKRLADDTEAVILHAYWDALLFRTSPGFTAVDAKVAALLNDPQLQRDQLPELAKTEFLDWAEESLELAKTVVYQGSDGFLKATPLSKTKKVEVKGLNAPVLPDSYEKAAEAVAARRMVVAGYRLADQLRRVLKH
jgi:S1/P1 nuclease